jgi:hypothetical protein
MEIDLGRCDEDEQTSPAHHPSVIYPSVKFYSRYIRGNRAFICNAGAFRGLLDIILHHEITSNRELLRIICFHLGTNEDELQITDFVTLLTRSCQVFRSKKAAHILCSHIWMRNSCLGGSMSSMLGALLFMIAMP